MKRLALILALAVVAPGRALAQQPTPEEVIAALSAKAQGLQQTLDGTYLQMARNNAAAEAQKATLIEWLKAAQAKP